MTRQAVFMAAAAVAAFTTVAAIAADPQRPPRWGQVEGTYVWVIKQNPLLPSIMTYHSGGTMQLTPGNMFGGQPNSTTRSSPVQGVWERTGPQSIAGMTLWLVFDANTGILTAFSRGRSSFQYSDDFNSFEGKLFMETLACSPGPPVSCPDPQDPAAKWVANPAMPPEGFDVTSVRLQRVAPGPL